MSLGRAIYTKTLRFVYALVSFVQKTLNCGEKKKFGEAAFESGDELGSHQEEKASLLNDGYMDTWDDTEWDKKEEVHDKIEQWRNSKAQPEVSVQQVNEEEDLFSTLEPTITNARKVVLKPKQPQQVAKRNLFVFDETNMGGATSLGEIDDDVKDAWGEDDLENVLQQHETSGSLI